jgi:hypothetical protein
MGRTAPLRSKLRSLVRLTGAFVSAAQLATTDGNDHNGLHRLLRPASLRAGGDLKCHKLL